MCHAAQRRNPGRYEPIPRGSEDGTGEVQAEVQLDPIPALTFHQMKEPPTTELDGAGAGGRTPLLFVESLIVGTRGRVGQAGKPVDGWRVLVNDLNLQVGPGEVFCVLGRSGIGKSRLLRAVAGLDDLVGSLALCSPPGNSPLRIDGTAERVVPSGAAGAVMPCQVY